MQVTCAPDELWLCWSPKNLNTPNRSPCLLNNGVDGCYLRSKSVGATSIHNSHVVKTLGQHEEWWQVSLLTLLGELLNWDQNGKQLNMLSCKKGYLNTFLSIRINCRSEFSIGLFSGFSLYCYFILSLCKYFLWMFSISSYGGIVCIFCNW